MLPPARLERHPTCDGGCQTGGVGQQGVGEVASGDAGDGREVAIGSGVEGDDVVARAKRTANAFNETGLALADDVQVDVCRA